MTATPPSRPTLTDRALAEKQARAEREAAALRANLRKRKQQVQARQAQDAPPPERKPRA